MLLQYKSLSLALAMEASSAVLKKALNLDLRVSIAVTDAGGQLIHLAHMDGVPPHTREIAIDKAYTAACFGFPTAEWRERLLGMSREVLEGLGNRPRLILFGGGVPVRWDGQALGAIGISGASEEEDVLCAEAGVVRILQLIHASHGVRAGGQGRLQVPLA